MRPNDQNNGDQSRPDQSQDGLSHSRNSSGNQSNTNTGNGEERQGFQPTVVNLPKEAELFRALEKSFKRIR